LHVKAKKNWNSLSSVGFTVYHDDPEKPTTDEYLAGLLTRVAALMSGMARGLDPEVIEAFQHPDDTMPNDVGWQSLDW